MEHDGGVSGTSRVQGNSDREGLDVSTLPPLVGSEQGAAAPAELLGLAVLWSRDDASHVGEVLLVEQGSCVTFGRGTSGTESGPHRGLARLSPTGRSSIRLLRNPRVSRNQLRLSVCDSDHLQVENVGSCALVQGGREVKSARLGVGDVIALQNELLFLCVRRPARLAGPLGPIGLLGHSFGRADEFGLVGESAPIWQLRGQLLTLAAQPFHVLILGASGTGKELVAQAIHRHSPRGDRPLISRSAATIPESIIDAELFGNARGYPNPGMPERPGLIGAAHASSLFLDEVAELPHALQAHLLRVLDAGEYQRLGETKLRRADIRVIGATNRAASSLKHDLLARLSLRVSLPDLNSRREDIPLLINHLLRRQAARDEALRLRIFPDADPAATPRVSPTLIAALVQHDYVTNVRELEALLLAAALKDGGPYLELDRGSRQQAVSVPVAVPVPETAGPWLTDEEHSRLALLRRHRFSPTACGRDPDYPGNRQTADLHFRHLACKALAFASWDIGRAAIVLAGSTDAQLLEKCRGRLETFVGNLDARIATEPFEQLTAALVEDWKGLVGAVLPLVAMLKAQRQTGTLPPP